MTPSTALRSQYGFGGRLTAAFPSQVIVDATEFCNLGCVHCPHPSFKASPHFTGRNLDPGLHRKMIDEVREHGRGLTQYLRYTSNGEPLLHPRIYDMLDDAVQRSGTFVALTTNGTAMDERRVERLLASGLHLVDVSIDAFTATTYARIRVGGDLNLTAANVRRLIELKSSTGATTRIVVSFIEQPLNAGEAEPFERYWREQGADAVVVRRLHSAAGAVVAVAEVMRGAQRHVPRYPCLYPWERILLNARGELAFCPQDWVHGSVLADYRDTTILDVWQGPAYQRLREAHLCGSFEGHGFCGGCPDWRQTRWPDQGTSYADLVEQFRNA